jgi:hypothetical protein
MLTDLEMYCDVDTGGIKRLKFFTPTTHPDQVSLCACLFVFVIGLYF